MDKITIFSGILLIIILSAFTLWYYKIPISPEIIFAANFLVFLSIALVAVKWMTNEDSYLNKARTETLEIEGDEIYILFQKIKKKWWDMKKEKLSFDDSSLYMNTYIPTAGGKTEKLHGFLLTRTSGLMIGMPIVFVVNNRGEIKYVNPDPLPQEYENLFSGYSPRILGAPVPRPDLMYEPGRDRRREAMKRKGKQDVDEEENDDDELMPYIGVPDEFI